MPCCLLKKARKPWFPYYPRSTILLCQTPWLSSIHRKWSWKFSINEEGKTRKTANRSPYWHPFFVVFVLFCFHFFVFCFFSFSFLFICFIFNRFFFFIFFFGNFFFFVFLSFSFFFFQFFFSNCVILCFCLNIQLNQSHYLLAALSAL